MLELQPPPSLPSTLTPPWDAPRDREPPPPFSRPELEPRRRIFWPERPLRRFRPLRIRALKHGCYFLQWRPARTTWYRYNGTLRVERREAGVTASGDLYRHGSFKIRRWPRFGITPNPDPSPSAGIPVFPRAAYRFYLRITGILEGLTTADSFTLTFERHRFDRASDTWSDEGEFSASMVFKSPPSGYPSGAIYLEGDVTDPSGGDAGTLSMGWVSPYLRKAVLEIDRVSASEYPADNGAAVDWQEVYDAVDWEVEVEESDTDLTEPSGSSWSDAEMHATMLNRRDSSDLDSVWRYYLICVRNLDATSRGIMFDAYSGDSNNIPREGAGLASHWTIPDTDVWGTVRGQRFGTAAAPYFRTAVHEIGHAMGLYHNTTDNGFMNTTGTIAASSGTFPGNVQWSFNGEDARRLRHMPDPWVRPGMIPFGQAYSSAPISPEDRGDVGEVLELTVEPLLPSVPIGAPVRVRLTLTNRAEVPVQVPDSLSLKSEHVSGRVTAPSGRARPFRSIFRCIEEREVATLEPGGSLTHDLTLLRGGEGALFPDPGVHEIHVDVTWELDGLPVRASGSAPVMVTPPESESHASTAMKTLCCPDLLLTLALGGDHMEEATAVLEAAMDDATLAPHYQVIQAKRIARRFRKRKADPGRALELIDDATVMSPSEVRRIASLARDLGAEDVKKKGRAKAISALEKKCGGIKDAEEAVEKLGG